MKYIKTKDRIWLSEKIGFDDSGCAYSKITGFYQDFNKNSIIKEADNSEDLVDCYSYETETTTDLGVALGWKFHDKNRHVYGCIKTNKGLIYMGELNSEGNLKLFNEQ